MTTAVDGLEIDRRTLFIIRADGRIERENDPDQSPGPRFLLARCPEGNVLGVRADVPDEIAAELESLATAEPPCTVPLMRSRHLERYRALVAKTNAVVRQTFGLIYELPHSLRCESHAQLVSGDRQRVNVWRSPCPSAE